VTAPAKPEAASPAPQVKARFTEGSTMKHVVELTYTASIGLMAIFIVDFLSLFYVAQLGDERLTAGVGYATTLMFLGISVNIGGMIAGAALVARKIGAGDRDGARRLASSGLVLGGLTAIIVSALMLTFLSSLLGAVGASGVPHEVAKRFLWITLPANLLMAIGMMLSGFLRAVGDPQRAMRVTLFGGIVTAVADPALIFWAGLGTDGAAWATVIGRMVFTAVGLHGLVKVHNLLGRIDLRAAFADFRAFFDIAGPAVLTNIATPVGSLLLLRLLAPFGEAAIAANAILDRLIPVAFGVLFALSGAIGPILAQNLGARRFDRIRQAMLDAFLLSAVYCFVAWCVLALLRHHIAGIFGVSGDAARYVAFFCLVGGLGWLFTGLVLCANASFNNLGFPLYSTVFNWGRATIGTVPFGWVGGQIAGVEGVMTGIVVGSALFGAAAMWAAFRTTRLIEEREKAAAETV
jgi:putative MATE family efflux protein